ncbi:CoA transferase [Saccharopolyspora spinosporotrichia]
MRPSPTEIMTVTASRLLDDDAVVFAGVGIPLLASALARRRQAPNLTIVLEGGIVGTHLVPGRLPISTNEMRAAFGAPMLTDITDIFLFAQRGSSTTASSVRRRSTGTATSTPATSEHRRRPRCACPVAAAPTTSSRCATRSSS